MLGLDPRQVVHFVMQGEALGMDLFALHDSAIFGARDSHQHHGRVSLGPTDQALEIDWVGMLENPAWVFEFRTAHECLGMVVKDGHIHFVDDC
jgi:hypothetical protein